MTFQLTKIYNTHIDRKPSPFQERMHNHCWWHSVVSGQWTLFQHYWPCADYDHPLWDTQMLFIIKWKCKKVKKFHLLVEKVAFVIKLQNIVGHPFSEVEVDSDVFFLIGQVQPWEGWVKGFNSCSGSEPRVSLAKCKMLKPPGQHNPWCLAYKSPYILI